MAGYALRIAAVLAEVQGAAEVVVPRPAGMLLRIHRSGGRGIRPCCGQAKLVLVESPARVQGDGSSAIWLANPSIALEVP